MKNPRKIIWSKSKRDLQSTNGVCKEMTTCRLFASKDCSFIGRNTSLHLVQHRSLFFCSGYSHWRQMFWRLLLSFDEVRELMD